MSSAQITDPEVLAFIERTVAFYPDGAVSRSVEAQRNLYDRMAAAFRQPRPGAVAVDQAAFDGPGGMIAVRRYWPAKPGPARILYFHGGGFVVGGLDSHDDVCAEIATRCRAEVTSVDYRLCPEHPHPAAYEDCLAAVDFFADRPIVVVGDSAGGNLAAAVAQARPTQIKGQVLIYPGLGGERQGLPAYTERAEAPLLTTRDVQTYATLRAGGAVPVNDASFSPLIAENLGQVPPCFISAAEHDPLRDDGAAYVLRLAHEGVAAELCVEPELPHGHLRARTSSKRAAQAFDRIVAAIEGMVHP